MSEEAFRVNDKRVDESWKDNVSKEQKEEPSSTGSSSQKPASIGFSDFITSLAIQAMMQMGLFPPAEGKEPVVNLAAAKELIDLLVLLKDKTRGNLAGDEEKLMNSIVADLQLKYVQSSK